MSEASQTAPLRHNSKAGHPLIAGPDGLTPAWLTAVLHSAGAVRNATVTHVASQPVGNGMLGQNLQLTLAYDQHEATAPATLVAKLASSGAESRASSAALKLYERETRFYQELAPRIRTGLPRTYFADISTAGDTFCLLFEDLTPARMGDQLAGCSLADAETAMRTAAALHAPFWDEPALLGKQWINGDILKHLYIERLPAYIPEFEQRFAKLLEPGAMDVARGFANCIEKYFANHTAPCTVSHQDFRLDNLMFDARDGAVPLAVLDWQTFVPGPGALDAAYFNGAGLLAPVRRDNERALANLYYDTLLVHGVSGYDRQRCWHDYRLHAAHGMIMSIVGAAITTPTARGDQMLSTMINRHAVQMMDLDTLTLIQEG